MPERLLNAALLQAGWFACVLGGEGPGLWLAAGILLAHVLRHPAPATQTRLLMMVALTGLLLDSALIWLGVLDFGSGQWLAPLWLVMLWALLATTLDYSLAWTARPWWLASLVGAFGGPLSYYAGSQLTNVELPLGTGWSLAVLAVVWAVIFPVLHLLARNSGSR